MRSSMAVVASALILSLLALQGTQVWAASASRVVVSTNHLAVGLTFPSSAHLGETIVIGASITAQSNARIISFSIEILAYVNGQLVRLASQTILADKTVQTGDQWQASLAVVIPANTQPGPLAGRLTEVWQATPNYYSNYYQSNYGSSRYSTSYCSLYRNNGYYNNAYYNYAYRNYPYNTQYYSPYNTQAYVCRPSPYYQSNYAPNYGTSYASQVSQRTFMLTSITYY